MEIDIGVVGVVGIGIEVGIVGIGIDVEIVLDPEYSEKVKTPIPIWILFS
jgi:hypothetical protein